MLQKKLQSLTKESQQLESDIQSRVDILTKIEAETRIVQKVRTVEQYSIVSGDNAYI